MREFRDRVAVITGAASGIGRGLAQRCALEGMKVVLADVDVPTLNQTEEEIKAIGADVLSVPTDVSKAGDVGALADKTLERFGAVHLLFNNAGVATVSDIWQSSLAEWEWVLGVNLWGVIHGVHIFVPIMLNQAEESYIVNTASGAGLDSGPGLGVYRVSKHGVVSLSETLHLELAQRGAKVKVSVLCPGFVDTNLMDTSARNRPATAAVTQNAEETARVESLRQGVRAGTSPDELAGLVFAAIKEDRFYILPHSEAKERIRLRMEDILNERNPTNPSD